MNFHSHRPLSTVLVSMLFAAAGCGSHDSNVGTSQLATDEGRGKGGSGGGGGGSGGSGGGGGTCDFAKEAGHGVAVECASGKALLEVDIIECEDLFAKCLAIAESDPMLSVTCEFEGVTIFEQDSKAGICDNVGGGGGSGGAGGSGGGGGGGGDPCGFAKNPGVGRFVDCVTGEEGGSTQIECDAMLLKCESIAEFDPLRNFTCSWEGVTIFEQEVEPGVCDGQGGGGSGYCAPDEVSVPVYINGGPTGDRKCVPFDEHYEDLADNCIAPQLVVFACHDVGSPQAYCALDCWY